MDLIKNKYVYCPFCARKWESLQALQELEQVGLVWVGKCPGCGRLCKVESALWEKGGVLVRPDWHSWVYGSAKNPNKR